MEILKYLAMGGALLLLCFGVYAKVTAPLWPRTLQALELAVLVRGTTLSATDVLTQLNNFMTREDKIAVEAILMRVTSWELIDLFRLNGDWKSIYEHHGFTGPERAVLDEWLEDVNNITRMPF